jgi:hypothetical protein
MHASAAVREGSTSPIRGTGRASQRVGLVRKASIVFVAACVEAILVAGLLAATLGTTFDGPSSRVGQTPEPAPAPGLNAH